MLLETGTMPLPNGFTLFWEPNGVGGRTYCSDESGGGVTVWDTCLVEESTIHAALNVEAMFLRQEQFYLRLKNANRKANRKAKR